MAARNLPGFAGSGTSSPVGRSGVPIYGLSAVVVVPLFLFLRLYPPAASVRPRAQW